MDLGLKIEHSGLLGNLFVYLNNVFGAEFTKQQLLNMLFQEKDVGTTSGGYSTLFNHDVFLTDYADKLTDPEKNLTKYYETELFVQLGDNDELKRGIFNALRTGTRQYLDDREFFEELEKYNDKKIGRLNRPCKNGGWTAAEKLVQYYDRMLNTCETIDSKTFACGLYSALYYLEYAVIPENYSDVINGISRDRQEFIEEVVLKYGCSGKPGKERIYRMANRKKPNSIALFEAGELEYYGKGVSSKPDYQKAYDYYIKAVQAHEFNPLAGWSLGYMLYYYGDEKNPIYNADIKEIKCMSPNKRIDAAVKILKKSLDCGCPAAANVIGLILLDEKIDEFVRETVKEKYHLEDGIEYFKIASDAGYSYAKNNLYKHYLEKSVCDGDEDFVVAYQYIKESAQLGNTYAMNKYAKFYLIDYKNDKQAALPYLNEAAMLSEDWAAWNILNDYCNDENGLCMVTSLPNINNEPALLEEYIDKLKNMCDNTDVDDIKTNFTKWLEGKGEKWNLSKEKSKV